MAWYSCDKCGKEFEKKHEDGENVCITAEDNGIGLIVKEIFCDDCGGINKKQ